jgi:integrase
MRYRRLNQETLSEDGSDGLVADAKLRIWHRLLEQAGIKRRSFHTSRHTAASLLLAEGVPMKFIQEVLGHSLLSTTADIYGHLFRQVFAEAADAMDRALG